MDASQTYLLALICIGIQRSTCVQKTVYDETQFSNPLSFDYNFDDEDNRQPDSNDIYDELVPYLPGFNVHKNGVDIGYTRLPTVTRKGALWSTRTTRPQSFEPYYGWHTTPLPRYKQPVNHPAYRGNTIDKQKSKTEDLIKEDPKEQKSEDLRFEKFARRFGVNRVTQATTSSSVKENKSEKPKSILQQSEIRRNFRQNPLAQQLRMHRLVTQPTELTKAPSLWTTSRSTTSRPTTPWVTTTKPTTARTTPWHITTRSTTTRSTTPWGTTTKPTSLRLNKSRFITSQPTSPSLTSTRTSPLRPFQDLHHETSRPTTPTYAGIYAQKKNVSLLNHAVKTGRSIDPRRVGFKPLAISIDGLPFKGPTFGCPVLIPRLNGHPSSNTDKSCATKEPGISADGRCRCTYEVTERDGKGCALYYEFTCVPR